MIYNGQRNTCLSIRKTCGFSLVEDRIHQRLCSACVNIHVISSLVKNFVKRKTMLLGVFGQVHLCPVDLLFACNYKRENYFGSLTTTPLRPFISTISFSLLVISFLLNGRFLTHTLILWLYSALKSILRAYYEKNIKSVIKVTSFSVSCLSLA